MRIALAAVALGLLVAGSARAQSPDDRKKALEHFEAAEAHLKAGEYDQAIEEYQAAYTLVPRPGFYYNIARAYELKGDREHALEYYTRYLELDPQGRASSEARTRAVAIEHELADEARARAAEPPPGPGGDQAGDAGAGGGDQAGDTGGGDQAGDTGGGDQAGDTGVGAQPAPAAAVELTRPRRSSGRVYRIAGISAVAAGLAMLGGAVYFGLQVSARQDDLAPYYDDERPWDSHAADLVERGNSAAVGANMLIGLGGVAVVGGAVLYYVGWNKKERRAARGLAVIPIEKGGLAVTWACEL